MEQKTVSLKENSGRTHTIFVYENKVDNTFRIALDNEWVKIQDGETLESAVVAYMSRQSRKAWPNHPEYWIAT